MTDKEKLEQIYDTMKGQDGVDYSRIMIADLEIFAKAILDWHKEEVAKERARLGEILRQEFEPNMDKYIIGRLEQSHEDTIVEVTENTGIPHSKLFSFIKDESIAEQSQEEND